MSALLVNLNLVIFAITAGFGFLIYSLSKNIWYKFQRDNDSKFDYQEYGLNIILKAFTAFYLISILSIAVSVPALTIMLWPDIQTLPGEMPYGIGILMGFIAIGGVIAYAISVQKRRHLDQVYLKVDLLSEPELTNLVLSLGRYFEIDDIKGIRLTPGSNIEITETAETFDEVFSGGDKQVEIGLSAMELLSASDLKVLMARQFAHFSENDNPPVAFIRRLKTRFEVMNDNIMGGGFLLALNPVAWMVMGAGSIIDRLTSEYMMMSEYRADQLVLGYAGTNRLSHALARYGVETELYKELINIVDNRKRGERIAFEGNIYDSMRRAQSETTDQLRIMINHLFQDSSLAGGDSDKRTLKLRLNRLPETPFIPTFEIKRPAIAYLKDWRNTENRMIKLLKL